MVWIEMSHDEVHGGGDWRFSKSLWAPTYKRSKTDVKSKWTYWETVNQVKKGDRILHLRGKSNTSFLGISIAAFDGVETLECPPDPGPWGYSKSFYRVILERYEEFETPIYLKDIFASKEAILRDYFQRNKKLKKKKSIFYVIQAGKLQCQNGAYLSECDSELFEILLDAKCYGENERKVSDLTDTGITYLATRGRKGQNKFSESVRANFGSKCCFPECTVSEADFLIGGHIARWADHIEWSGHTSNGLCFCLMHDKAFEKGYFTLSSTGEILINESFSRSQESLWCKENIIPFQGKKIKQSQIEISPEAVRKHHHRIGYKEK